jgi:hypothetical protein
MNSSCVVLENGDRRDMAYKAADGYKDSPTQALLQYTIMT